MITTRALPAFAAAMLGACGGAAPETSEALPESQAHAEDPGDLQRALGMAAAGDPRLPAEILPGGDCPAATAPDHDAGPVPMIPGLTLTTMWQRTPSEEFECLLQITAVDATGIDGTYSCATPEGEKSYPRRLCVADLAGARALITQTGTHTVLGADGKQLPETVVGATWFSLSQHEFAQLASNGAFLHHYLQPMERRPGQLAIDSRAELRREARETARLAVNHGTVEVPVIRVSGAADHWRFGAREKGRITALVLDDERFPLLVDYAHYVDGIAEPVFRVNFAKVSFPSAGSAGETAASDLERQLAEEKSVDVYGIYFAFNSDRIRPESEPVLQEIAALMQRHSGWKLTIHGHTDDVGDASYNVTLSARRGEAVRRALVELGIAESRLSSAGHGARAPREPNDTPEGRARNRRVELVRS